ncbi:MAG: flagellar biosynthesis protein FlhB [Nevskiales bacterium]
MSEEKDQQDRTEQPTPKRVREAREKGQVPRSRDMQGAIVVGAAALSFTVFGGDIAAGTLQWLYDCINNAAQVGAEVEAQKLPGYYLAALADGLWVITPVLIATFIAAIIGPLFIGGWNISGKALAPDLKRLDPIKGIGRLFSLNSLAELGRSLLKVFLIAGIAIIALWQLAPELLGLARTIEGTGLPRTFGAVAWVFVLLSLALLLIGLIDAPYQIWQNLRKLRMTKQEVIDEMKETEGRPEVKSKLRNLQQEIARGRMMEAVPEADVVVVNPTHFAVALVYKAGRMNAPKVVAKGMDEVAARIREIADENRVPILSAPPLARVLYRSCDLEQEVPASLYTAIAQVLTWVYQIQRWQPGKGQKRPVEPSVELPGEWKKKDEEWLKATQ